MNKKAVLTLIFGILLLISGCNNKNNKNVVIDSSSDMQYKEAVKLIQNKEYDKAKQELNSLKSYDPHVQELKDFIELRNTLIKDDTGILIANESFKSPDKEIEPLYHQLKVDMMALLKQKTVSFLDQNKYQEVSSSLANKINDDYELEALYNYASAETILISNGNIDLAKSYMNLIPSTYRGIYADKINHEQSRVLGMNQTTPSIIIPESPSDEVLKQIHKGMNLNEVLSLRNDVVGKDGDGYVYFANGDRYFFDNVCDPPILETISGPGVDSKGNRIKVLYGIKNGKMIRIK